MNDEVLAKQDGQRRLVRSDLSQPGIRRLRCGRGFRYLTPEGRRPDDATIARIRALAIPPAWQQVWICPSPGGHIQAVGTDSAGRRQYLYHQLWRRRRDAAKHDRVLEFARVLPTVRERVECHLNQRGLLRERVLAAAVRLVDLGFFRPGGEEYAAENGTFGLATIQRSHVRVTGRQITFDYPAKGSKHREHAVVDDQVAKVIRSLMRRPGDGRLLAYRAGRHWHEVTAADINAYLREISGGDFTVKDFRTWHATVLAAVGLAVSPAPPASPHAVKRAVARVNREVADYLGNTPAVARSSYIDPRVVDDYRDGTTIARVLAELGQGHEFGELATAGRAEAAVLRMLRDRQVPGRAE